MKTFDMCCKKAQAKKAAATHAKWDVFISYRQAADEKLVELLYSHLSALEVTQNGVTRKMKVFWGAKFTYVFNMYVYTYVCVCVCMM